MRLLFPAGHGFVCSSGSSSGRILNPRTARNQFLGGMVWGISMDERLVRFVNNNFAEYHIPLHADVPAIEALWVDEQPTPWASRASAKLESPEEPQRC